MKPAAVTKKPTINTEAALKFASQNSPQAVKSSTARGKAGAGTTKATEASKRAFFAPEGDKRLTINLRQDLHKRLKILAVERETTIGDIIEDLVERHL